MAVEDAAERFRSYKGVMVEVSIALDAEGGERQHLAAFSGVVDEVTHYEGPSEHWTMRFINDGTRPHQGSVTIWRDGYEGTDTAEEPDNLAIRHCGVSIELHAYI
jgi:hypothetical protein